MNRRALAGLVAVIAAWSIVVPLQHAAADPDMVAARRAAFGAANVADDGSVRADRVILSWFGVTNFAAAIGGHVVLLDAWVPRGEYSGYIPASPASLAALKPEYIFAGHSHFDHLADGAQIIASSGATLVGTPEQCQQVRRQAAASQVNCILAVDPGAPFGATRELAAALGWGNVGVTVVKHVHSAGRQPHPEDPHTPAAPPPDFGAVVEHMPAPQDTVHLASHLGDAENGTVLYQFRVGAFSLLWHDSSGPLSDDAPNVFDVLRSLPPTDVQVGAIMGFNQITNGLRDPRMYIEAIAPKVFVPSHHDNWAPPVSTRAENYRPILVEELERIPAAARPELRFIADPQDYMRPDALTFDITDPRWA